MPGAFNRNLESSPIPAVASATPTGASSIGLSDSHPLLDGSLHDAEEEAQDHTEAVEPVLDTQQITQKQDLLMYRKPCRVWSTKATQS